ncbi:MAG: MFS transporter [Alistipes sp.]|nr:MFS transporter [Alistipes sp.]
MKINTGKGSVSLVALIAILSISAIVSLPGLAISPILDDLESIFPHASELEVEMLESLPSLMIIPFMLLSGRWSVKYSKIRLVVLGTAIFLLSGIGSLMSRSLMELIILSAVMGIGAGIIIPLSTGLIVDCFVGEYRVKQLGISSAVNNLTLVLATVLTGYLAGIKWYYAFAVYLLPAITLILIPALSSATPNLTPQNQDDSNAPASISSKRIFALMLFYFMITYCSLVVTFNTSYIAAAQKMSSDVAGWIISLFFLAIMLPGFVLNGVKRALGKATNFWSLVVMGIGLVLMSLPHPRLYTLIIGALLTGFGYGVMQPLIYDKAASCSPPKLATLALSLVMAVNYLAILVAPFIMDVVDRLFHTSQHTFAFMFNGVVTLIMALLSLRWRGGLYAQ